MVIVRRHEIGTWIRYEYYMDVVDGVTMRKCRRTAHDTAKDAGSGRNPRHERYN